MAVIDWWNGPLTLVVIFFALCLLLLTWSIAGVACRACHSSGTFFHCKRVAGMRTTSSRHHTWRSIFFFKNALCDLLWQEKIARWHENCLDRRRRKDSEVSPRDACMFALKAPCSLRCTRLLAGACSRTMYVDDKKIWDVVPCTSLVSEVIPTT